MKQNEDFAKGRGRMKEMVTRQQGLEEGSREEGRKEKQTPPGDSSFSNQPGGAPGWINQMRPPENQTPPRDHGKGETCARLH